MIVIITKGIFIKMFYVGTHMEREPASREKKLSMVNFLISVQKNVSRIRFQEIKIRPLKGFEKMRFLFLHFRGIGVFWPKIPLNLTFEGL